MIAIDPYIRTERLQRSIFNGAQEEVKVMFMIINDNNIETIEMESIEWTVVQHKTH